MAPDEQPATRRLALLVATGTYSDPALSALRAPTGDVQSLATVLRDDAIGGFDVRELIDRPTEELKKEIEAFFGAGRPKDLLLLYVSGHGVLSQSRRFYFATASTTLQWLRSTAIEDSFVNDVMQASRARSIVLVLDCCHSGAFGKGLVPKSALSVDVEHRFEGRGRVTLTASTELEYAFEESDPATGINELGPAAPGSLFTRAFVEGLRSGEADIDEDGRISVDDVYDYVCRRVRERSPNQTPGMAGDVRGQIVLARSSRQAVLPPELARAAASNMAGIREGAVSELEVLVRAGGPVALSARDALERLAADDSRAVSAAALTALGRPPATPVVPEPEPAEPEPPPPEPPAPPQPPEPRRRWPLIAGIAAGAAAVAIAAVLLLGGSEPPPGPTTAAGAYEFGDSRPSVVLGAANAAKAGDAVNGGVVVIGDAGSDEFQRITAADTAGAPTPENGDRFGTSLASGDFDKDGTADLAIGAPGRRSVALMYGLDQRSKTIAAADLHARDGVFAFQLVARDFDRDGYGDLLIGIPGSTSQKSPKDGSVQLVPGGRGGLDAAQARALETDDPAGFGFKLAAGDIDGDGEIDVVAGTAYGLQLCRGGPDGPTACSVAASDAGTSSIAVADVNDDGHADVVQGDESADGGRGVVRLWLGRDRGLPDAPDATIDQATRGVDGDPAAGDEFGHDVVAADVDGDHKADVVVAARGDEDGAGTVTLVPGGAAGLDAARAAWLPFQVPDGQLGATLTLLDADDDGQPDLFAGVKAATSADDAVVVFPGKDGGGFDPGEPVGGLAKLVEIQPDSPLRLGR